MRRSLWIGAGLLLSVPIAVLAKPEIQAGAHKALKIKPTSRVGQAQCVLCHVAPNNYKFNRFGHDLHEAAEKLKVKAFTPELIKLVGRIDSDKDGYTNARELAADTLPGDPKSKPRK
ncbi:MAG: hypothetical protein HUU17_05325 [Chthonomonadales bacterium]|nr:hypothetical protein [Chthonomonadales bacterium]